MKSVTSTMSKLVIWWLIGTVSGWILDQGMGQVFEPDVVKNDPEVVTAPISGNITLNCSLDFPQGNEIPFYVEWRKDVSTHT